MREEVLLPQWGMAMTEATVVRWFAGEGEEVVQDADLVEVEASKVLGTVPVPVSGRLSRILVKADETVPVWSVLAEIEVDS